MNWFLYCEDMGSFKERAPGDTVKCCNIGFRDGRESEDSFGISSTGQSLPVSDGMLG